MQVFLNFRFRPSGEEDTDDADDESAEKQNKFVVFICGQSDEPLFKRFFNPSLICTNATSRIANLIITITGILHVWELILLQLYSIISFLFVFWLSSSGHNCFRGSVKVRADFHDKHDYCGRSGSVYVCRHASALLSAGEHKQNNV